MTQLVCKASRFYNLLKAEARNLGWLRSDNRQTDKIFYIIINANLIFSGKTPRQELELWKGIKVENLKGYLFRNLVQTQSQTRVKISHLLRMDRPCYLINNNDMVYWCMYISFTITWIIVVRSRQRNIEMYIYPVLWNIFFCLVMKRFSIISIIW